MKSHIPEEVGTPKVLGGKRQRQTQGPQRGRGGAGLLLWGVGGGLSWPLSSCCAQHWAPFPGPQTHSSSDSNP